MTTLRTRLSGQVTRQGHILADKCIETGLCITDKTVVPSEASDYINGSEVVALRTERDGLRELVAYLQGQLKDADWRYQELLQQLKMSQQNVSQLVRALPTADTASPKASQSQRRRWWPFGKGNH